MRPSKPDSGPEQTLLFGRDLLHQLDPADALIQLSDQINWRVFDQAFGGHYSPTPVARGCRFADWWVC